MSSLPGKVSFLRTAERSIREAGRWLRRPFRPFRDSQTYWEKRYARGLTSGTGSRGNLAEFKSNVINRLLLEHEIESAIEFGCGDGHQLGLVAYPEYTGFDVSPSAIQRCRENYRDDASKSFRLVAEHEGEKADLTLSLDVIYHLVEDDVFEQHMRLLFDSSRSTVLIYSTNFELPPAEQPAHIRHRCFTNWIDQHSPDWKLVEQIENEHTRGGKHGSSAEFFVFNLL